MPEKAATDLVSAMDADRPLAVARFRSMSLDEQLTAVRGAPDQRRYDVITLADDCTEIVQQLTPQEVYRIVSEEELWRVGAMVSTATPDQLQGIMDLSCWKGDALDEEGALVWLDWLCGLPDQELAERLRAIDVDLLASVLAPHMTVTAGNPLATGQTPEGGFVVYQGRITSTPGAFSLPMASIAILIGPLDSPARPVTLPPTHHEPATRSPSRPLRSPCRCRPRNGDIPCAGASLHRTWGRRRPTGAIPSRGSCVCGPVSWSSFSSEQP